MPADHRRWVALANPRDGHSSTSARVPVIGDQVMTSMSRGWSTTVEVDLVYVNPAIWWSVFGVIRPDLLHDACGVNGEYA